MRRGSPSDRLLCCHLGCSLASSPSPVTQPPHCHHGRLLGPRDPAGAGLQHTEDTASPEVSQVTPGLRHPSRCSQSPHFLRGPTHSPPSPGGQGPRLHPCQPQSHLQPTSPTSPPHPPPVPAPARNGAGICGFISFSEAGTCPPSQSWFYVLSVLEAC